MSEQQHNTGGITAGVAMPSATSVDEAFRRTHLSLEIGMIPFDLLPEHSEARKALRALALAGKVGDVRRPAVEGGRWMVIVKGVAFTVEQYVAHYMRHPDVFAIGG